MKKVLLTLSALTLMTSIAMAAPVTDLQKGESLVGYSYWNPSVTVNPYDLGKTNSNGFYAGTAIDDKFIIGVETVKGSKTTNNISMDTQFTDISLNYKLNKNVQLIIGDRSYDTTASALGYTVSQSTNKFFYGVAETSEIGKNTSAYVSVIHSNIADDWQVGANYNFSKNAAFNVNYRSYTEDWGSLKGPGTGVSYKF